MTSTNNNNEEEEEQLQEEEEYDMSIEEDDDNIDPIGKFHFSIDRGGTFTDIYCILPNGMEVVRKLLSEDPTHYMDAPTEGIRRIMTEYYSNNNKSNNKSSKVAKSALDRNGKVRSMDIGSIRMGTTVATNALLERDGERMALLVTAGYQDLLEIGNQSRPNIFDLKCMKAKTLYERVLPIEERIILKEHVQSSDNCKNMNNNNNNNKGNIEYIEEHVGVTGETVCIVKRPNLELIRQQLEELYNDGIRSIAICFMHSYTYHQHEIDVGTIAQSMKCFHRISLSHMVMPTVRIVPRGHTVCVAAYLTPKIDQYLKSFTSGFDDELLLVSSSSSSSSVTNNNNNNNTQVTFMKSDGGLTPIHNFGGHQAILSGPAGGVVGYAQTCYHNHANKQQQHEAEEEEDGVSSSSPSPVIGFDMGGTSTDVSRYDGRYEHVFETTLDGITISSPQLDINTVAAGGGSRLYLKHGRYVVGPESSRAYPGPVCYGKVGGLLAVTDANVVLGRIQPKYFPHIFGPNEDQPLDVQASRDAFQKLINDSIASGDFAGSGSGGSTANETPPSSRLPSIEEVAYGFIQVANESMCRPIRNLTQMRGYDITTHKLACFGGAGPQHACSIAKSLGMKYVLIHKYGGILSAYGLSMAESVYDIQQPTAEIYNIKELKKSKNKLSDIGERKFKELTTTALNELQKQGYDVGDIHDDDNSNSSSNKKVRIERYLNMRYEGTDNAIMIPEQDCDGSSEETYDETFIKFYMREYGFTLRDRDILIDDYRIRAIVTNSKSNQSSTYPASKAPPHAPPTSSPKPTIDIKTGKEEYVNIYYEDGYHNVPVYKMDELQPGHVIVGPSIIIQPISTIVLEIDCIAKITFTGDIEITIGTTSSSNNNNNNNNQKKKKKEEENNKRQKEEEEEEKEMSTITQKVSSGAPPAAAADVADPVQLSIFVHRFMGIAEQMGKTLQRTSISVNMKERLDFSCALFTADGGLVSNAPHIPIHLGAMERAVKFQIEYWNTHNRGGIHNGEVLVSNHPQLAGGSHLPDITVITPVFHETTGDIIFFVASRGHHADIGGIVPGSMPPHSTKLQDEGAMIVAYKLVTADGTFQEDGITDILNSPGSIPGNFGTRNIRDNISDLRAQVAANNSGIRLLKELVTEYGYPVVHSYMYHIQQNAELSIRSMLKEFITKHNNNKTRTHAIDYMDDGTPIELTIDIDPETGNAIFDFTGTGPQVYGNHNAPPAVTYSAVIYSLRSLVNDDIPLNQGCLKPITFILPQYTLLNPSTDSAVVGGNVLTSQRIVDVVLKAFHACAASQGCMNNITFGNEKFGYYETIGGGSGAGPTWSGTSGVHTHCTNTRITDPEILERRYPVLLHEFSIRPNSGGIGQYCGGNGIVREIEPLCPLTMSILSERRSIPPYGMKGGHPGKVGRNLLLKQNRKQQRNTKQQQQEKTNHTDGDNDDDDDSITIITNLGGRCTGTLNVGERLRIETPGGGGYGTPPVAKTTTTTTASTTTTTTT